MIIYLKNKQTLQAGKFYFKCCIGKKGLTRKKIEGDNKTPIGSFNLEHLYYRADKLKKPFTNLKTIRITKKMSWCDDVRSKYYNKLLKINKKVRHEKLYRRDFKYDLLIPIKYNFNKPKKSLGSCIFIHLTKNYSSTKGCIGLKKNDFLILLKLINKKSKINIT